MAATEPPDDDGEVSATAASVVQRRDATSPERNARRARRAANGDAVVRAEIPLARFLQAAARYGYIEQEDRRTLEIASPADRAEELQRIMETIVAAWCDAVLPPLSDRASAELDPTPRRVHPLVAVDVAIDVLSKSPAGSALQVAEALTLFRNSGIAFHVALGLGTGWFNADRLRERSELLRRIAERLSDDRKPESPDEQDESKRALAISVVSVLQKYEGKSWRRDRDQRRRPSGLDGLCYDFLTTGAVPSSETVRKALG